MQRARTTCQAPGSSAAERTPGHRELHIVVTGASLLTPGGNIASGDGLIRASYEALRVGRLSPA